VTLEDTLQACRAMIRLVNSDDRSTVEVSIVDQAALTAAGR
jgi:hypothetical protein